MVPLHRSPVPTLATTLDGANHRPPRGPRWSALPLYTLSLLFLATIVVGFIWHDLREAYRDTLAYWDVKLSNTANERVRIATLWLKDRRTDTELLASGSQIARLLSMKANGSNLAETRQHAEESLGRIARINDFLGGAVADTECRIVAQVGVPAAAMADVPNVCREAQQKGEFSAAASGPPQTHVWLYLAFPVFADEGTSRSGQASRRELGAVVMIAEPWKSVFSPFISPGIEPTRTTDTLVVWEDSGEAAFFSPRLVMGGAESGVRRPLKEPTFESRVAREGDVKFGEFIDYRGVRVFGAARPIGAGQGSLACKVDRDEALSVFRKRAVLEVLAGALSLLLFGSVIAVQHRHVATQDLKEKLKQQQALLDLKRHVEVSEERFRELVQGVEAIVWESDAATLRVIFVSQGVERILGFSPDQWLQTPNFWADHLHPQDRERAQACERETREKGNLLSVEYRMAGADGRFHWFQDSMHVVKGAEDNAKLVRGIMVDITESKEVEEALAESQALLNSIINSTSDWICSVDAKSVRLLSFNQSLSDYFLRAFGIRVEKGMRPEDLLPTDDLQQKWLEHYQRALRDGSYTTEYSMATAQKTLQVSFNVLTRDGVAFGVSVFAKDITERKQAELALQASQERYRAFVANSTEGIWRYEGDQPIPTALPVEEQMEKFFQFGYLAECNDAMARMYGFERAEEMIGRRFRDLIGDDPRNPDYMRAFIRSGYRLEEVETYNRRQGGKVRYFSSSYYGVVEKGCLVRAWCVQRDITERKRAEAELADRLRFETLLADLSARFVNVPAEQLGSEIRDAQRRVCKCLGLEVSTLWQASEENPRFITLTHLYRALAGPPAPEQIDAQEYFPWCLQQLLAGKVIAVSSMEELPAEAARDREVFRQFGIKASLTLPLSIGGGPTLGALSFNTMRAEHTWPGEIVSRLQLVAQMFSNALARQRANRALQESEERLHLAAASAGAGFWNWHFATDSFWVTKETQELVGFSPEEVVNFDRVLSVIHPEDRDSIRASVQRVVQAKNEGNTEFRIIRADGSVRWIYARGRVRCRASGEPDSLLGVALDITERKRAEEERQRSLEQMRALAARLQNIREEERKRVAREIHDQLGQGLTAIKLDLCSLVREMGGDPQQPSQRASSILNLVDETIQTVRRISTELRPGILDDLGLVAAIEWAGEDFQARTGTKCRLDLPPEDIAIDPERATAVFRILQETLTNVARHADASEVEIQLGKKDKDLTLFVHDNGKGMHTDKPSNRKSLGILGMQERAVVFGGEVIICSAPEMGTTVKVRIPEASRT